MAENASSSSLDPLPIPPANLSVCSSHEEDLASQKSEELINERVAAFLNSYGLSPFQANVAKAWLTRMSDPESEEDLKRVKEWFFMQLNNTKPKSSTIPPFQKGCPDIIPGLRAFPWWSADLLPWLHDLEASYETVRNELFSLRKGHHGKSPIEGFQPYRAPSWASGTKADDGVGKVGTDSGAWHVFYLYLHNIKFEENLEKCPVTTELLTRVLPRSSNYKHAFFSVLAPNTHVTQHHGPTNKKLRVHLPLVVPEGGHSKLRVADDTRVIREGKCYCFDDSFEHEAWNDHPSEPRIVLIIDVWHPDLSLKEVKFLTFLQDASLRADRQLAQGQEDTFYSIIEEAKTLDVDEKAIWG
jgi:aspartate beta-hydroxylase